MGDFRVKQKVIWKSSAAGSTVEKVGKIIAVVLPHQDPIKALEGSGRRHGDYSSRYGGGLTRSHESYLVEVHSKKGKPLLYWPRVRLLRGSG